MVEISPKLPGVLLLEDLNPASLSRRSDNDQLSKAAQYRNAASKRSLGMGTRQRGLSVLDPSGRENPNQCPNSPNQSAVSTTEEDPKRSRPETSSSVNCGQRDETPKAATAVGFKEQPKNNQLVQALSSNSSSATRPKPLFQRRTRHNSAPLILESLGETALQSEQNHPAIICQVSRLPQNRLQTLLKSEPEYHPNNAFLYYVDPVAEGKVDANLRNEAVHSLRFMHNAFFTLTSEAFCKAVNLIDRFIVKVKVKPKYISCVTAAAYYVAAKLVETAPDLGVPSPDILVQISQCGGTSADLVRMEQILTSKLGGDVNGVNAFDFLRLFASTAIVLPDRGGGAVGHTPDELASSACDEVDGNANGELLSVSADVEHGGQLLLSRHHHSYPETTSAVEGSADPAETCDDDETSLVPQGRRMYSVWSAMTSRLVVALCSLEIYRFRSAAVALAVLHQFRVAGVTELAKLCGVQLREVIDCSALIKELYDVYYRDSHPSSRKTLVWTLSKRTLSRLGCSSPTPLDTISEDCENDKDDNLQFNFEP